MLGIVDNGLIPSLDMGRTAMPVFVDSIDTIWQLPIFPLSSRFPGEVGSS